MLPQTPAGGESRACVQVTNLPQLATEDWLRGLFVPIGAVNEVSLDRSGDALCAQVYFGSVEEAAAALQYDGFRTLGQMIRVRPHPSIALPHPVPAPSVVSPTDALLGANRRALPRARRDSDPSKTFRNLYVGNLPLNVNTDQMAALFSQYGNVTHCVILSTLDTQARRRGFIVMASPDESRLAIKGLNGFVWHGYPIEVSFALVQRSGGPLDPDGESTVSRNVPRSRYNTGPRKSPEDEEYASIDFYSHREAAFSQRSTVDAFASQSTGTADIHEAKSLIVSSLDPAAVIDNDDFMRIMLPYGPIAAATLCRDDHGGSRGFGIVTFEKESDATRACAQLNQREIHGRRLRAQRYVHSSARLSAPSPSASYNLPWRTPSSTSPLPLTPALPTSSLNRNVDRSLASSIHAPMSATAAPSSGSMRFSTPFDSVRSPQALDSELSGLLGSMKLGSASGMPKVSPAGPSTSASATAGTIGESSPAFFQPSRKAVSVSIRPDPLDIANRDKPSDRATAAELGEAFEQRPKEEVEHEGASTSRERFNESESSLGGRTGLSLSPWSSNSGSNGNAANDRLSPHTTFSASPASAKSIVRSPDEGKDKELGPPFLPGTTLASLTKAAESEMPWRSALARAKPQAQAAEVAAQSSEAANVQTEK